MIISDNTSYVKYCGDSANLSAKSTLEATAASRERSILGEPSDCARKIAGLSRFDACHLSPGVRQGGNDRSLISARGFEGDDGRANARIETARRSDVGGNSFVPEVEGEHTLIQSFATSTAQQVWGKVMGHIPRSGPGQALDLRGRHGEHPLQLFRFMWRRANEGHASQRDQPPWDGTGSRLPTHHARSLTDKDARDPSQMALQRACVRMDLSVRRCSAAA